jgi:predicted kinase
MAEQKFKVIIVAGEPCTGKTTLIKEAFNPAAMPKMFQYEKLRGHVKENLFIAGIYGQDPIFEGTDKLSMSVQPSAVGFISHMKYGSLVAEGDRLANAKFLQSCADFDVHTHLVILHAPNETLAERHTGRGDNQSSSWLASRQTKVQNLRAAALAMPHVTVHQLRNENRSSLGEHVAFLRELARCV